MAEKKKKYTSGLGKIKSEKARRLFVIHGKDMETIAIMLKVKLATVQKTCSRDKWFNQREEFEREKTAEARQIVLYEEAERAAECRKLAWECVELQLKRMKRHLKKRDNKDKPNAFAIQAMVNVAVSLKNNVSDPKARRPDLDGASFQDVLKKAIKAMGENLIHEDKNRDAKPVNKDAEQAEELARELEKELGLEEGS